MDVLNQPHDKLFRSIFGKVDAATDFLVNYLPKGILETVNLGTLEAQQGSFLDEDLEEEFSDLLFKTKINGKEGYIYFLFEHKSYKDKMVIFQVLKYMINIWEDIIQEDKKAKKLDGIRPSGKIELPVILPLVIYHADSPWNIAKTLGGMIPNYGDFSEELKRYIPDFEYLLIDLSNFNKDKVKLNIENMVALKVLTKIRYATIEEARDILREVIELIEKAEEKDDITYYVSVCIRYILSIRDDISKDEMVKIAGLISTEGGELVMSVAEQLRQEGIEEGIQKGKKTSAKKTAKIMMVNGEKTDKIMTYTGLTKEEIKEIKEEMLK